MSRIYLFLFFTLISTFLSAQFGPERIVNEYLENPADAISFDVNNDGANDMVSISFGDSLFAWNLNVGSGVLGKLNTIKCDMQSLYEIDTLDFDNDGYTDVVAISGVDSKIALFRNNTLGGFNQPLFISNQSNWIHVVHSYDVDNDGDQDVLVGSSNDGKVAWFSNLGGGSFSSENIIVSGIANLTDFLIFDFDNDNDGDVLIASYSTDSVMFYENLSASSFVSGVLVTNQADGVTGLDAFDIDSDGLTDIITIANLDNQISWHRNLGGTTFSSEKVIAFAANVVEVEMMDYDNDSDLDLFFARGPSTGNIHSMEQLSDTTFSPSQLVASTNGINGLSKNDIDNDGLYDLVFTSYYNNNDRIVGWIKHNGGGVFAEIEQVVPDVLMPWKQMEIDVNTDGLMDIVSVNSSSNEINYLLNEGNGNFSKAILISDQHDDVVGVDVADFNNDNQPDIVVCSMYDNLIVWYENNGAGFNPQSVISNLSTTPIQVCVNDFDNDGWLDVAAASFGDNKIVWFKNTGGAFLSENILSTSLTGARSIGTIDWNMDGEMDIIAGGTNNLELFENQGTGVFSAPVVISNNMNYVFDVLSGNINSDTLPDIVASSTFDDEVLWFENLNGSFATPAIISNGVDNVESLSLADLNNDGDLDIISSSYQDVQFYIHENHVFGTSFTTSEYPASNFLMSGVRDAKTIDFDSDGDLDILTSSPNLKTISIFENYHLSNYQLRGRIFVDLDSNGVYDSLDYGVQNVSIDSSPLADYSYTYSDGFYFLNLDTTSFGSYVISPNLPQYWGLSTDSVSYNILTYQGFSFIDSLDFGLYPDTNVTVIDVELVANSSRCDTEVTYLIDVYNPGTNIAEGVIALELDDSLTFISSGVLQDSISNGIIYWSYDSLSYFEYERISLTVLTPDFNSIGDSLTSIVTVYSQDSLGTSFDTSIDTLIGLVICAYDPNDKLVTPMGIGSPGYIDTTVQTLEYTIRFQNTGNDTANKVVILDQLDSSLDWGTLVPLSASHDYTVDINPQGLVTFTFNDIFLPDSNANELLSHGFIHFKIDLLSGLLPGVEIENFGEIYFDQNPAVITNTAINTIYECGLTFEGLNVNGSLCFEDSLTWSDTVVATNYVWNVNAVPTGDSTDLEITFNNSGAYVVTIQGVNEFCVADTTIDFLVLPEVDTTYLNDILLCPSDSIEVFGTYHSAPGVYFNHLQSVHGCDSIVSRSIVNYSAYSFDTDSIDLCVGDSTLVFGSYEDVPGLYIDSLLSENGCDSIRKIFIEQKDLPIIDFGNVLEDTVCINNEDIVLSGSSPSGGSYAGSGVSAGSFSPSLAGLGWHEITYSFSDAYGCSNFKTDSIFVDGCLFINENALIEAVVKPNPFTDIIHISIKEAYQNKVDVFVFDQLGKVVYNGKLDAEGKINCAYLKSGSYILELKDGQDLLARKKMIKM